MARRKEVAEELEVEKEEVLQPEDFLEDFLKDNEGDHLQGITELDYKISSGCLSLDIELSGGYGPGFHRFAGHNNSGKALTSWSHVLKETGWEVLKNIKVGDKIYGEDGELKKVLGVYPQGPKEYFKVSFSDGTSVHCCGEHFWETTTLLDRSANREGTLKTTKDIAASLLYCGSVNHAVPQPTPVKFPKRNFLIHPYVMGALLGDGSLSGGITIHNSKDDVLERLHKLLPEGYGIKTESHERRDGTIKRYGKLYLSKKEGFGRNEIKNELFRLGLFGAVCYNKFIPNEYLHSDVESRIELLRGLIDTDGYIPEKKPYAIYFYSTSEVLAKNVAELVRSLGGRATMTVKLDNKYKNKGVVKIGKPCYTLYISFNSSDIIPYFSLRKSHFSPKTRRTEKFIKSIESVGIDECICIKIDSQRGLFITDGYVLTHNTPSALELQANFLKYHNSNKQKARGILVRAEGRLSQENMARTGATYVFDAKEWKDGTVFVFNCQKYETIATFIGKLVRENPTNTLYNFIIDSMDGLKVKADEGKGFDENVKVAGAPLLSKRFLSDLSLEINVKGHQGLLISQVAAEIKVDPYAKTTPRDGSFSGGNSIGHFVNWTIEFNKFYQSDLILDNPNGKLNDGKTKVLGHWSKVCIRKSTNEKNYITVTYPIRHGVTGKSAVWVEYEIIDQLLAWEMVTAGGAWFTISPALIAELKENNLTIPEKINGSEKMRKFLEENPAITNYLFDKFRKVLTGIKAGA